MGKTKPRRQQSKVSNRTNDTATAKRVADLNVKTADAEAEASTPQLMNRLTSLSSKTEDLALLQMAWMKTIESECMEENGRIPTDDSKYYHLTEYCTDITAIKLALEFIKTRLEIRSTEAKLALLPFYLSLKKFPFDALDDKWKLFYTKTLFALDQPCKAKKYFDLIANSTSRLTIKDECRKLAKRCITSASSFKRETCLKDRIQYIYDAIDDIFVDDGSNPELSSLLTITPEENRYELQQGYILTLRCALPDIPIHVTGKFDDHVYIYFDTKDDPVNGLLLNFILPKLPEMVMQTQISYRFLNIPKSECAITINGEQVHYDDFSFIMSGCNELKARTIKLLKVNKQVLANADHEFIQWVGNRLVESIVGQRAKDSLLVVKYLGNHDEVDQAEIGEDEIHSMHDLLEMVDELNVEEFSLSLSPDMYLPDDPFRSCGQMPGSSIIYQGDEEQKQEVFARFDRLAEAGVTYARLAIPLKAFMSNLESRYPEYLEGEIRSYEQLVDSLNSNAHTNLSFIKAFIADNTRVFTLNDHQKSDLKHTVDGDAIYFTDLYCTPKNLYIDFAAYDYDNATSLLNLFIMEDCGLDRADVPIINFDRFNVDNVNPVDY